MSNPSVSRPERMPFLVLLCAYHRGDRRASVRVAPGGRAQLTPAKGPTNSRGAPPLRFGSERRRCCARITDSEDGTSVVSARVPAAAVALPIVSVLEVRMPVPHVAILLDAACRSRTPPPERRTSAARGRFSRAADSSWTQSPCRTIWPFGMSGKNVTRTRVISLPRGHFLHGRLPFMRPLRTPKLVELVEDGPGFPRCPEWRRVWSVPTSSGVSRPLCAAPGEHAVSSGRVPPTARVTPRATRSRWRTTAARTIYTVLALVLLVRRSMTEDDGRLVFDTTKTNEARVVPLPRFLADQVAQVSRRPNP